ncbi:MAG TPA: response regulator [Candidatus Limnocylindrales bacterium]|nr:response regulator [Candidatus Limnocylindrales bacterium]
MSEQIRVVIVDDIAETREHLTKLLSFESDIEVVGAASSGEEAVDLTGKLTPDILLMDINMPGMDGIATTERISATFPATSIIMMSVQGEADYLRRSMLAGAREFLVKPFSSDELTSSIRQVHVREKQKRGRMVVAFQGAAGGPGESGKKNGKIVTLFAPKGGVGRTTLAVNLAVAMAGEQRQTVTLVDGSFQFGDVGVLLNLNPKNKSIIDVVADPTATDEDLVDTTLINHSTGIKVLLAPPSPEMAELVTVDQIRRMMHRLRETNDFTVVDLWPHFNDVSLALLDMSDVILTILTLEITNIKNIRLFLEVAEQLGYGDRLKLVLNRADSAFGIRVADVESSVGRKIDHQVVSDGRTVVYALNRGVPFVWSNSQAPVSEDILKISRALVAEASATEAEAEQEKAKKSIFGRR